MVSFGNKIQTDRLLKFDVETYHKLGAIQAIPRNTELIHGLIIYKMTLSPIHSKIVNKLRNMISKYLKEGFVVFQESPITIEDSEPEPDIFIIQGNYDDYGESHPSTASIVIEIAYSSLEDDIEKANIYAIANVPEYWIVDIKNHQIIVYKTPIQNVYSIVNNYSESEKIQVPQTEGLFISLNELF